MFTFEGNIIKWWLESTAVQADRIVWPNKSKFEAISYADGFIEKVLSSRSQLRIVTLHCLR